MNKFELIEAIAKSADISKAAAGRALDGAVAAIQVSLKKGAMVTLVGFGTFYVQARSTQRTQPAHGRRNQDQGCKSAEVPRWQSPQGCSKLARFVRPHRLTPCESDDRNHAAPHREFAGRQGFLGTTYGCLAQLVERRPYKANVGGSSPSAPTSGT